MKSILSVLAGMIILTICLPAAAMTNTITAMYSPSMGSPEKNVFINTTPVSGFCTKNPDKCQSESLSSMTLGLEAALTAGGLAANAPAREGMYFKMPGAWRSVTVTNSEGDEAIIQFRVALFSARYNTRNSWTTTQHKEAWDSTFVYAPSPCSYSGSSTGTSKSYSFGWFWPASDAACYKTTKKDLAGEPYLIDDMGIAYALKFPDPVKMPAGIYTGTLRLTAGPGGHFDFGDLFAVNDQSVVFSFSLTVNQELQLKTTVENRNIGLQPCATGKVCTEEQGKANWERWMVNRVTPQLSGRSNFNLSSTGKFIAYLQCEHQSGPDCALKSDKQGFLIPLKTTLTLPDNIIDSATNSTVNRKPMVVGREAVTSSFDTTVVGHNKKGSIDFQIEQKFVDLMLFGRPDTARGAVTVIFDARLD